MEILGPIPAQLTETQARQDKTEKIKMELNNILQL